MRCVETLDELGWLRTVPSICDVAVVTDLQETLMLAAGLVIFPPITALVGVPAAVIKNVPPSITVVPSHSLHRTWFDAAVSFNKTVPNANHVPEMPLGALGPSVKVDAFNAVGPAI